MRIEPGRAWTEQEVQEIKRLWIESERGCKSVEYRYHRVWFESAPKITVVVQPHAATTLAHQIRRRSTERASRESGEANGNEPFRIRELRTMFTLAVKGTHQCASRRRCKQEDVLRWRNSLLLTKYPALLRTLPGIPQPTSPALGVLYGTWTGRGPYRSHTPRPCPPP
jgi:hypothetical protein